MFLTKEAKLGSGTYGKVYKSKNKDGEVFAVKINLCDDQFDSQCAIKELDINATLDHPCIMPLITVSNGNPFGDEELTSPLDMSYQRGLRHDTLHFVFPVACCDLHTYAYSKKMDMNEIQMFSMHILLGLEYLHGLGIMHRDLKLNNILIALEDNLYVAKISDFGLSKHYVRYQHHTPDAITYNHRPIECTIRTTYGYKADIWSLGCMMYEMLMREPLINVGEPRNNVNYLVTQEIICKVPTYVPIEKIKREFVFISTNRRRHISMKSLLGNINNEDFVNLMSKILEIDDTLRFTATDCLNHRFFDNVRCHIDHTRTNYKPVRIEYTLKVIDSIQRKHIMLKMYFIYLNRSRYIWYSHKIWFHAAMMMDRIIGTNMIDDVNEHILNLYCYTMCYMFSKYFAGVMTRSFPFSTALESNCNYSLTNNDICNAIEFEKKVIESLEYRIYQPTIYDILCDDHQPNDAEIESIVLFYLNINKIMPQEFTIKQAYSKWYELYKK